MTKDLIERLEAGTGADLGAAGSILPRSLAAALFGEGFTIPQKLLCRAALSDGIEAIGASLALVGEKLPGWMVAFAGPWRWADHTARGGQPIWCAEIVRCTEENGIGYREVNDLKHRAPTPALAVLIALLKALETK